MKCISNNVANALMKKSRKRNVLIGDPSRVINFGLSLHDPFYSYLSSDGLVGYIGKIEFPTLRTTPRRPARIHVSDPF